MLSEKDFKVGELVRFKDIGNQRTVPSRYTSFYGELCLMVGVEDDGEEDEYDTLRVRCLATGEIAICYVHRLEQLS